MFKIIKHKLASVLAIGQLYHQSATAPGCNTQLRDVRDLPLFVRRSSKPVSCTFLDKFFIPLHFRFLSGNWRISCQAPYPFELHKFLIKICLLQYHFEIFTSYLLKFTSQWRHVYVMNKISKQLIYIVFIPVSRYVKVIKIHQDFPELWLQMYCQLFYGSQCS